MLKTFSGTKSHLVFFFFLNDNEWMTFDTAQQGLQTYNNLCELGFKLQLTVERRLMCAMSGSTINTCSWATYRALSFSMKGRYSVLFLMSK